MTPLCTGLISKAAGWGVGWVTATVVFREHCKNWGACHLFELLPSGRRYRIENMHKQTQEQFLCLSHNYTQHCQSLKLTFPNVQYRMCNASCAIPAKCECVVFLFVSLRTASIFIVLQFDNKFVIVFVICMLPFHKKIILGSFRCWADLEHVLKVIYSHWEQQKRDFMTILLN